MRQNGGGVEGGAYFPLTAAQPTCVDEFEKLRYKEPPEPMFLAFLQFLLLIADYQAIERLVGSC